MAGGGAVNFFLAWGQPTNCYRAKRWGFALFVVFYFEVFVVFICSLVLGQDILLRLTDHIRRDLGQPWLSVIHHHLGKGNSPGVNVVESRVIHTPYNHQFGSLIVGDDHIFTLAVVEDPNVLLVELVTKLISEGRHLFCSVGESGNCWSLLLVRWGT